jgi:DNA-binding Lrp family transcriptional regulator
VGALEPVRLLDLAEATGIPGPTVHRLLKQLIEVGAVRREGTRYRLGASLSELGARVTTLAFRSGYPNRVAGYRREWPQRAYTPRSAAQHRLWTPVVTWHTSAASR